MGIYLSTTSISLLLPGWLSGNTTSSDTEGVAIFGAHIDRAESHVNAACGNKYTIPFSPIPPFIRTIVEDISTYYALRGGGARQGQVNEYMDEYKMALESLKKIAEGEMALTNTDGSLVPIVAESRMLSSSDDHELIMNMDEPRNWRVNDAERSDIESTRDVD